MTPLDRKLAQTFRAARWESTDGVPGCPDCFDGDDLETPTEDPRVPGLSRYRCNVCRVEFSDVKGTCFQTVKSTSLALLAYLVLGGDLERIPVTGTERRRCWDITRRTRGTWLAMAWRGRLELAGVTTQRIATQLNAARRAA